MENYHKLKVGMISLGCSKNQVDSEVMLGLISREGYEIVNCSKDADVIIINTCGFIESARKAIDTILEQAVYKNKKCQRTNCYRLSSTALW